MAGIPPFQPSINPEIHHFGYQGVAEVTSKPSEEALTTLLIRHLPEAVPYDTLSRLFSHYGACSLRPCTIGRMRNCAFVDFKTEALASQAQRQLNGLQFLGKVLSVERASKPTENNKHQQSEAQLGKHSTSSMKDATVKKNLSEGPKLGSFPASEPIAERLGVDYPFPPHLEYAYPPPDGNILTNIVNALIAVPQFYTQVLHLMNKMNIPAPFRMALPTPPLPSSALAPPPPPPPPSPPVATEPHLADLSSGESEMESSDEEVDGKADSVGAPTVVRSKRKRIKREAIVGPAVNKDVAHEAVGLKPASLVPKEIPVIKKKNSVLQIKIAPKQIQSEQMETDINKDSEEPEKGNSNLKRYATPEELESGKLPPEEILSLPMFKNYMAGNPASVLYIKNLAKDVVTDDFYFIFGSLFGNIDAAQSGLNVKLMQEGRMRGQAFVTFPSVEIAHHALNLVNGYVFKGKPMIIQFGRNLTTTKAN
uniref:Putative RNA-binding family protein isoform 1 n=1 Tax=Davidia involucrata TaxID=16924 RepID=A0A5B7CBE0_DAVIN